MPKPDLLKYKKQLKTKVSDKNTYVFDPVRKKYIVLTPEELVRQLFLQYLIQEKKIPLKHIAVERQIIIKNKPFRFDILVFNKKGNTDMIVECKSHKIKLTEETANQISNYNLKLKAPYLCITNGLNSLFYKINFDDNSILPIDY